MRNLSRRARFRAEHVDGYEVNQNDAAQMTRTMTPTRGDVDARRRRGGRGARLRALVATLVCVACGAFAVKHGAFAMDATDDIATLRMDVERARASAETFRAQADEAKRVKRDIEARLNAVTREKKAAMEEIAKLEEIVAELRSAKTSDVMDKAKRAAAGAAKRAEALARDAKPFIEDGVKKLKPALKKAGVSSRNIVKHARKMHAAKIKDAKLYLTPLRRRIKAKMKTMDAVKAYATDKNINFFFEVVINLALAMIVHRFVGRLYRGLFGRTLKPVPRHVRSKSVEFRPLSPPESTRVFAPRP